MAKIKYSALVQSMRNKLNGSVASRNRYGDFWRNKTSPVNRQTTHQTAVRALFAANSSAWRGLTASQRQAWIEAAPNFPFTDVFGDQLTLSGNALYLKLNQNLQNAGEDPISEPPAPVAIPVLAGFKLTFADGVYSISWDNTVTGDFKLMIYAAPNVSTGRQYVKNLFKFCGVVDTLTSPQEISTLLTDRLGSLQAGTALWVKALLVSTDSGQQGLPSQASIVVV
ncbi:MAG: hypothetical protein DIU81_006830 [[Clostridium] cellulosi]